MITNNAHGHSAKKKAPYERSQAHNQKTQQNENIKMVLGIVFVIAIIVLAIYCFTKYPSDSLTEQIENIKREKQNLLAKRNKLQEIQTRLLAKAHKIFRYVSALACGFFLLSITVLIYLDYGWVTAFEGPLLVITVINSIMSIALFDKLSANELINWTKNKIAQRVYKHHEFAERTMYKLSDEIQRCETQLKKLE